MPLLIFMERKNDMIQQITRVDTRHMSRDDWLKLRRKTIGGSDAAGIVGLSRYSSPYTVWANKTGRLPDSEDNEAMRQGRDLEEYVAKRWMESTGKTVRRCNAMIYNSHYPFAHADIDRAVVGERAGLECKTTSTLNLTQFHGVEFPEQYYVQCVHYLAVTGWERWYLAVLVLGKGFYTFTLERNQDEIDALMAAEQNFWNYVETDIPPELDGSKSTADALQTVFPVSTGGDMQLFGRETLLQDYFLLREQKNALEEQIEQIENTIKADMQNYEHGNCGCFSVSWKTQIRRQFQQKVFAEKHPEIDLTPYYKNISVRPLKITQI